MDSILYFNEAVYFKQNYKYTKVIRADILYLEAYGNHTNIHTKDTRQVIRHTLNTLLEKLSQPDLVRIHRSYAVNFRHISMFNDHTVCLGANELSLGRHYKDDFFGRFDFLWFSRGRPYAIHVPLPRFCFSYTKTRHRHSFQ